MTSDLRPKDLVKQYIRDRQPDLDDFSVLFDFVYWMEGQDRDPMDCRVHVVEASEDDGLCPFDVGGDDDQ
jgi:hypothetical protein